MFGSFGLYAGDKFFGIIHGQKLFFRTTEKTRHDYTAAGMTIFRPNAKQSLKNYYVVPPNVLEDREALVTWARRAIRPQK
jgi:DNA transformation protein and related proteins